MKKSKKNNKGPLLFILFLIVAVVIVVLVKVFYIPTKTYHSNFLKISIDYPSSYQLEDKLTDIILNNSKGKITISTNGTNYDSIDGYLNSLSKLNHLTITNKKEIKMRYEDAIEVTIDSKQKDYFFYPAKWVVYFISTSSPDLYPDLDRIAKSFRYEP